MKTDSLCVESNRVEFHRASVSVAPAFDLALHTAEPSDDQQHSEEVTLPGYSRVAVMRSEENWLVRGRKVTNATTVAFPTIKSGKATATHLSIAIGGTIRRWLKLSKDVELKANRRVEFGPGEIELEEVS